MATPDGDWFCDEDDFERKELCYPVWVHCEECQGTPGATKIDPSYGGGLVPHGQGWPIEEHPGNLWYKAKDQLIGKFDICRICTGSGGGYACGLHDLNTPLST